MGKRLSHRLVIGAALLCMLAGCSSTSAEEGSGAATTSAAPPATEAVPAPTPTTPTTTTTVVLPEEVRSFQAARDYQTAPSPVAITIARIGVTSDLQDLHRNADGTLAVPDWHHAGWWADGPKPGQPGPAVIAGHVDSDDGPDVFYRLAELREGDEVVVTRADGSDVRFVVERLERHPKDAFPTEAVYAPTLEAGLRLVTCGGEFDRGSGHYRENVIAFATLMT